MEWVFVIIAIAVALCIAGLCIPQSNAMYGPQNRQAPKTNPPKVRKVNK